LFARLEGAPPVRSKNMRKEIVVDITPFQTRVVLLEDNVPSEIYIERRGRERIVGNIYKGRVQNVLPGMQAAFVDIGLERNAFLYAGDIQVDKGYIAVDDLQDPAALTPPNIKDIVRPGQEIVVQVLKEPIGTKGARVTTHITLPGRTLVLMPTVNYVGVSRRIEEEGERQRLRELLEKIKPENMGAIVRTAAHGKSEEEFEADTRFLVRLWERVQQKGQMLSAPRLLHAEEPLVFRTIRDIFTPDVERLVINDREFCEKVQLVAGIISPALAERVVLYESVPDLFDELGLEESIDKALARKVWMRNGGHIIIDQTEALTTIDVNTGRYVGSSDDLQQTITDTNCEAAREIARQLRLRDISGIIIIDFIDMEEICDKEKVLDTLRQELKKDRTRSNVLGITQLGLVEMTRKKSRKSISSTLQSPCPYCEGAGKVLSPESVLLKVRRRLMRTFSQETAQNYLVCVNPAVSELISQYEEESFSILPREKGRSIYLQSDANLHVESFTVQALHSREELKHAQENAIKY